MITIEEIAIALDSVGVREDMIITVHSFLGGFGHFEHGAMTVYNGAKKVIGAFGTLVIPTYTIRFLGGGNYDELNSTSETGVLSEAARSTKGIIRTKCPVYSHVVSGCKSHSYSQINSDETLGPDSLFAQLHQDNAMAVYFGTSLNRGATFLHYFERMVGVPYRYIKEFSGYVKYKNGPLQRKTVKHYARYLSSPVALNFDVFGEELIADGHMKTAYINRGKIMAIPLKVLYSEALRRYKKNRLFLVKQNV